MPDNLQQGAPGYAVGWFSLALINAGLAQGKGRSGLAWWLVSLLLGPIATFIIVVLPAAGASGAAVQPLGLTRVVVVAGAIVDHHRSVRPPGVSRHRTLKPLTVAPACIGGAMLLLA